MLLRRGLLLSHGLSVLSLLSLLLGGGALLGLLLGGGLGGGTLLRCLHRCALVLMRRSLC